MKILIACEFSGIAREAFAKKSHYVMSCDFLPTETPEKHRHYQGDVFDVLDARWDMMIAFPPCTYLTVTANRVFRNNPERWKKRLDSMLFVWKLWRLPIKKICIENPVGVISSHIRPPDQYIQPYQFGHPVSKKTGLWLKNLPLIKPTKIIEPEWIIPPSGKRMSKLHANNPSTTNTKNTRLRSRTFQGIADAMADQWG